MSYRKRDYADLDKWRNTANAHKRKYYSQTAIYGSRPWTEEEKQMLFDNDLTDRELSDKIRRSMKAIACMRSRLIKIHAGH